MDKENPIQPSPQEIKKPPVETTDSYLVEKKEIEDLLAQILQSDEYSPYNFRQLFELIDNYSRCYDDEQKNAYEELKKMMGYAFILHKNKLDTIFLNNQNKDLEDYATYIKMLFQFSLFLKHIDTESLYSSQNDEVSLFSRIAEVEKEMVKFVKANPEKAKRFLDNRISKLLDKPTKFIGGYYVSPFELLKEQIDYDDFKEQYTKQFEGAEWVLDPYAYDLVAVFQKDNPEILVIMSIQEIIKLIEDDKFSEIAKKAKSNYENQSSGKETLRSFDLPKDQKISYLRVFPREFDMVTGSSLHSSGMLAAAMMNNYNVDAPPAIFTDDPKTSFVEAISEAYKNGVRYFHLDIYSHGSEDFLDFKVKFRASDIVDIANKFPEAKFTITTIACFGGGLRKDFLYLFKSAPELMNRISVFLTTKPDVMAMSGVLKNYKESQLERPDIYSSYYYLFLIDGLQKKMTFGEAAERADFMTKKLTYGDPEAIINGKLISNLQTEFEGLISA